MDFEKLECLRDDIIIVVYIETSKFATRRQCKHCCCFCKKEQGVIVTKRKNSSRMHTDHMETRYCPRHPWMNRFEKVPIDHCQISLAVGREGRPRSDVLGEGEGIPYLVTYPIVHLILPTPLLTDRYTPVKTLPSCNFVGGNNVIIHISHLSCT